MDFIFGQYQVLWTWPSDIHLDRISLGQVLKTRYWPQLKSIIVYYYMTAIWAPLLLVKMGHMLALWKFIER